MPKCNFNKVAKQLIELNSLKTFQSTRISKYVRKFLSYHSREKKAKYKSVYN